MVVCIHDLQYAAYRNSNNTYNLPGPIGVLSELSVRMATNNTQKVDWFVREILDRDGIDDNGLHYTGTVNCTDNPHNREWRNACWISTCSQVVYGQQANGSGGLTSLATVLDIVAHETFHGITHNSSKLESRGQSGALNESYSDIFAVLIKNRDIPNIGRWDWEIGRPFGESGSSVRNLSNPSLHGHPEHIDQYLNTTSDGGGIHTNCSIHNKAAYILMNATYGYPNRPNDYLFDPASLSNLFYLALISLDRKSTFRDSGIALKRVAADKYRNTENLIRVEQAIDNAFQKVGIVLRI